MTVRRLASARSVYRSVPTALTRSTARSHDFARRDPVLSQRLQRGERARRRRFRRAPSAIAARMASSGSCRCGISCVIDGRTELDQVVLHLQRESSRPNPGTRPGGRRIAPELLSANAIAARTISDGIVAGAAFERRDRALVAGPAQPFGGGAAEECVLVGQPAREQRHARRVRDARQRVERRPRALAPARST